ncbi:hypothetical protein HSX37_17515|uniref:Predicted nucleotide-binding protein, sugar kinase/HSP70/actin superfamily n=1 Tax=Dendrosporobacter quercicolus TaxID=146817 RepID=A0A1G9ZHF1_9FIRM|nr:hypothetical protein [Dendrosporobacter quercicolus]NSL49817.1 hypothetical protein [Dendrosporobacter quercicolus DSM 1736]SDN20749.1 Predicted nucleotide-binding protein, sugar kinase/HSP70/actin superfamily [Dendrosporobacter quercicolus]
MMGSSFRKAAFSDDFTSIIDSNGNKIKISDQRVKHIWPFSENMFNATPFVRSIFENRGWHFRFLEPSFDIMHYSKMLCSGKECPSLNLLAGMYYEDIAKNYVNHNDIFVYWGVEHACPCQIGAWPNVWELFSERIGKNNVIYSAFVTLENNFLGRGLGFGTDLLKAFILGDLFDEAECVLKTIAVNKEEALKVFKEETLKVVPSFHKGMKSLERSLQEWADNINKIPLKATLNETPKVLLFGGGAMVFLRGPLTEYCCQQGVIPKIVGFHEFLLYLFSDCARTYGFKKGYDSLDQQFNLAPLIFSLFNPKQNIGETKLAMYSYSTLIFANSMNKRLRKALQGSGIVYDKHVSYINILKEGHRFINNNVFSEAAVAIGKYINSIQTDVFDGLVNIALFTCQPSMHGLSFVRTLSHQYTIPFTGLELEGPWLSANHLRLLENVVFQARRLREMKNSRTTITDCLL